MCNFTTAPRLYEQKQADNEVSSLRRLQFLGLEIFCMDSETSYILLYLCKMGGYLALFMFPFFVFALYITNHIFKRKAKKYKSSHILSENDLPTVSSVVWNSVLVLSAVVSFFWFWSQ